MQDGLVHEAHHGAHLGGDYLSGMEVAGIQGVSQAVLDGIAQGEFVAGYGEGFYADAEGFIFPLQRNFASHVQIIDGEIPLAANSGYKGSIDNPKEKEWFERVMNVINYIDGSRTWKDKIVQISVDEGSDLILVPRDGNERFLFGQPTDIADKFDKMEKYYTNILPAKGAGYYRIVDLKYEGQIVCRKK